MTAALAAATAVNPSLSVDGPAHQQHISLAEHRALVSKRLEAQREEAARGVSELKADLKRRYAERERELRRSLENRVAQVRSAAPSNGCAKAQRPALCVWTEIKGHVRGSLCRATCACALILAIAPPCPPPQAGEAARDVCRMDQQAEERQHAARVDRLQVSGSVATEEGRSAGKSSREC